MYRFVSFNIYFSFLFFFFYIFFKTPFLYFTTHLLKRNIVEIVFFTKMGIKKNSTHFWFPNSNFPGPFLSRLPEIQEGMLPRTSVAMGSGVSSTERTRGAMDSSPLSSGQVSSSCLAPPECLVSSVGRDRNTFMKQCIHLQHALVQSNIVQVQTNCIVAQQTTLCRLHKL